MNEVGMGKTKKGKPRQDYLPCVTNYPAVCKKMDGMLSDHAAVGLHEDNQVIRMLHVLDVASFDEDLTCALANLSSFVQESKGVELFLKLGGIAKVIKCTFHSNVDVREKAVGTLRNLLLTAVEEDVCPILIEHDLASSLMQACFQTHRSISKTCQEDGVCIAETLQKELSFLAQCLSCFCTLCESSCVTYEKLDLSVVLPFIVVIITDAKMDSEMRITAAHCMHAISEDNPILNSFILGNQDAVAPLYYFMIGAITDHSDALLHALAAGILYNVASSLPPTLASQLAEKILVLMTLVLDISVIDMLQENCEGLLLVKVMHLLQAQQVLLELLSNMLSRNEDTWEDVEDEADVDLEPMDAGQDEKEEDLGNEILVRMKGFDLPSKIINCCKPAALNAPAEGDLQEKLNTLQNRAWQCLSNLLSVASLEDVGGISHLGDIWLLFLKSTFCTADQRLARTDVEFLDSVSTVMRSITAKLVESGLIEICSLDTIVLILKLLDESSIMDSSRMQLISTLGLIGKAVCSKAGARPMLQAIGRSFTELLKSSDNLVLIAEILDATFDTFADGPCVDDVLEETKLLPLLKSLATSLKSRMNRERLSLRENLGMVDMSRVNLLRFIKYKEQAVHPS